jgi:precorrin-6A/cobalt-precorrin-6A reductase
MHLLILGGTAEARTLAQSLHGRSGFMVTSSLAGRLNTPLLPLGDVRIGGFDGAAGLAEYLRSQEIDVVVDATHPFAATMTAHAIEATRTVGCQLVVLDRPGWSAGPGDRWIRVPDVAAAAEMVAGRPPGVVFLTIGRRDIKAFAGDSGHDFLIRSVEAPAGPLPPRASVILARGPFSIEDEAALLREYGVCLLVTKDTGGTMTGAKLAAARLEQIPVLFIDRLGRPEAPLVVGTVEEVLQALKDPLRGHARP